MSERRKIIYCIAAISGSQWLWLVNTIRCGDANRYQYGLQDIVCAALFVIIAWSFPAVKEIIKKAVKR